ncbi:restriction endonuclease subunit S [Methanoculleus sp. 7T]|uniref:restriction endonuclease subunit S n=1 Tax=Methanoculleus sp. 7T TaxID=2937282 RepID=UPI0020C0FF05|nr:restriction endonuclease subunit S [Methanoculleus sp. 7T]
MIPEDWDLDQLGNLTNRVGSGITPTGGEKVYTKEGRPFIRSQNVGWGELQLSDLAFITDEIHKTFATSEIEEGDVLLNITGASIGRSAVADPRIAGGNVNQHVCEIRTERQKLEPKYLNYYLLSVSGQGQIDSFQAGGNRQGLNYNQIRSFTIPLPPLPEQRAIAAALSDADGLIGALDALIEKKRAIKQAAMQQLLTGKNRLPGFSGEWETKRLGEVASIRNQKILPSNVDPDMLCVELEHIGQGNGQLLAISTAQNSTSSKYRFFTGDVLFGRLRSYLRKFWHADRDGICTTEIWPLVVDASQVDSGFLYTIVQSDRFVEAASISYGTHMPRADWSVMKNFEVCLPSLPEQTAIAAVLSDMDAEIAALERRREKAEQIKQGMMQQLLTGRIRLPSVGEANDQ